MYGQLYLKLAKIVPKAAYGPHFCYTSPQTIFQCCCNFIDPDTICWSFFNCEQVMTTITVHTLMQHVLLSHKGIWPVKTEWWDAGMVMCLGQGADLHMAQLMPLPLTISCSSKSRLLLPFWCQLIQCILLSYISTTYYHYHGYFPVMTNFGREPVAISGTGLFIGQMSFLTTTQITEELSKNLRKHTHKEVT